MYGISYWWKNNLSWKHLVTIKQSAGLKQDSSRMTFFSTRNCAITIQRSSYST
jgi:hypothetical protein